jgi:hypothetical protein
MVEFSLVIEDLLETKEFETIQRVKSVQTVDTLVLDKRLFEKHRM